MSNSGEVWDGNLHEYLNNELPVHFHSVFEFGVVLSGTVVYHFNQENVPLSKGMGIFVNSETIHSVHCLNEKPATMFTVGFSANLISHDHMTTIFQKYLQPVLLSKCKYFIIENEEMIVLLHEIYDDSHKNYNELHYFAQVIRLWEMCFTSFQKLSCIDENKGQINEDRVRKLINYVSLHYGEKISVKDLADEIHVSCNTCFRMFKKYLGLSPMVYIISYRINQAATMLLNSNMSVVDIALSCGFEDASYFGKVFKERTGFSPTAYRKERR